MRLGFIKSKEDSNLYFKVEDGRPVMLLLYVDVLFLKGEDKLIEDARMRLATKFEMKYLRMIQYFLGIEVWKNADGILLDQGKYVVDILKKFGMLNCKAITRPMESNLKLMCDSSINSLDAMMYRQMIGSLMFLNNMTQDICFVVNTLS